jgi:inosine-uridine nucleoside N-ribohydrolase
MMFFFSFLFISFHRQSLKGYNRTSIVTWDAALSASLGWSWFDAVAAAEGNKLGHFIGKICDKYQEITRFSSTFSHETFAPCDAFAIGVFLDPTIEEESLDAAVEVSTCKGVALGSLCIDHYNRMAKEGARKVHIVKRISRERFRHLMDSVFKA